MKSTKSWRLACIVVASLIPFSYAAAQDEDGLTRGEEGVAVAGPASDFEPGEVASQYLAAASRRLADAEAMRELDDSIAEIRKVIEDLIEERKRWRAERDGIANALANVNREIRDVNGDIDDVEDAIIASSIASAGFVSPELVATRDRLKARKNRLKADRDRLANDLRAADERLRQIEVLLGDAERKLARKRSEKHELEEQIAEVSLAAPSEGARLIVDSTEALQIRSDDAPEQIRIEVQRLREEQSSGARGEISTRSNRESWEVIYDRTFEWKDLETAGPGQVKLVFKTGQRPERRTMPIVGLEAFWLDRGVYRARVRRVGEPERDDRDHDDGGNFMEAPESGIGNDTGERDFGETQRPKDPEAGRPSDKPRDGQESRDPNRDSADRNPTREPIDWRRFSVVGKLGSEVLETPDPVQAGGPRIKYGSEQVKPGAVLRPTGAQDAEADE